MIYGLALSGGGTKGSYQAGAFMALNELGVDISTVVGTSIGAINGAFVAQKDIKKCIELWHDLDIYAEKYLPEDIENSGGVYDISDMTKLAGEVIQSGGISMAPLQKLLEQNIDEKAIRLSGIKYGLCTYCLTDLKGCELFINQIPAGKLIDYILASACFPGFKPVEIENELYIDGGVYNNLPINMLAVDKCSDIIAVVLNKKPLDKRLLDKFNSVKIIRPAISLGSTFNFSYKDLLYNHDLGWYDTQKSYGMFAGEFYYFAPHDYYLYVKHGSAKKISLIEYAAVIFGLERVRYITCKQLEQEVILYFKELYAKHDFDSDTFYDMIKSLITGSGNLLNITEKVLLNMCELNIKSEFNLHKKLAAKSFPKEYQTAELLCKISGIN